MKNKKMLIIMPILLILLSSCNTNQPINKPISDNTSAVTLTTTTTPVFENDKYIFVNKYGDSMDIREADEIWVSGDGEIDYRIASPEEALESDYAYFAKFNNIYMTKSVGVSYNSIEDLYDDEVGFVDIELPQKEYDYFKISVGDTFGTLTVKEAFTEYLYMTNEDLNYIHDSEIVFSGDITVTGYISSVVDNNIGYFIVGDIFFVVDAEKFIEIPIFKPYKYMLESRKSNNAHFLSDIRDMQLGNMFNDYDNVEFDIDVIPQDGSYKYVKITISDLKMNESNNGKIEGIWGKIKNIKEL